MKLITNPTAILSAIVARGLSMTEAANEAGIYPRNFSVLANHARSVTTKTAAKLRKAFGTEAVILSQPLKGGE